jgi:dUTP pyrophosphatase
MGNRINVFDYQTRLLESIENGTYEQVLSEITNELNQGTQIGKIPLQFSNKSNNPNPEYANIGDSGFDIRANLELEDGMFAAIKLGSLERVIISTGLFFELPQGFELQIRPRSGLAAKNGITVLNTPGTVDEQYRGEVKIILVNLSKEEFIVNHGDRIAQGVLANVSGQRIVSLVKIEEINKDTIRNESGFGSSGIK